MRPNSYYIDDDRRRYRYRSMSAFFGAMALIVMIGIVAVHRIIQWEEQNKEEVWVLYEVKCYDLNKAILYNHNNRQDSIVLRLPDGHKGFSGIEGIEILHYRLP